MTDRAEWVKLNLIIKVNDYAVLRIRMQRVVKSIVKSTREVYNYICTESISYFFLKSRKFENFSKDFWIRIPSFLHRILNTGINNDQRTCESLAFAQLGGGRPVFSPPPRKSLVAPLVTGWVMGKV